MKKIFKKVYKSAFTLAEVLITLGIIGVVAALTMPTLIQNHQRQVYVTGLKKAYSNISNAFSKMALDEDVTDWASTNCGNEFLAKLNNAEVDAGVCFESIAKQFKVVSKGLPNGYNMSGALERSAAFISTDGMIFLFDCGGAWPNVFIDVNGLKGPNQAGRDMFGFYIDVTKNKIIPFGIVTNTGDESEDWKDCSASNLSLNCTAKVIMEGKMDY